MSCYELHRVLYPLTKNIRSYDLPLTLKALGLEPLLCDLSCDASSDKAEDIERLVQEIDRQQADAVITHNFMIFAAIACALKKIPYIAWSWDSPDIPLYHESALLPTSFLFDFDRLQAEDSRKRGCPHVYHQPLAVNLSHAGQLVITPEDEARFGCDVSFIGALYGEEDYLIPADVPEDVRKEAETVIREATGIWDGTDRISDRLSDDAIRILGGSLAAKGKHTAEGVEFLVQRRSLEMRLLARRTAFLERTRLLARLAKYDLQFYTTAADLRIEIPGVKSRPPLHYYNEVPKAYYLSRINLNLTLHSIRSGVPLRVFDILGVGGFLLSNYQPELEELFVIGRELEVFRDPEEMEDKIAFYLAHEEARQRIALRGYERVRDHYTYEIQLAKILDAVCREERWDGELELSE